VTDWLQSPPNQPPPTFAEIVDVWRSAGIEPDPTASPAIDTLLDALRATNANGGAVFARFRIGTSATLQWVAARNRWPDYGLLDSFLRSPPVRLALPELKVGERLRAKPTWTEKSALTLGGELANELVVGGAYVSFQGPAAEAKAIGEAFCAALFGDRFGDIQLYETRTPWAPWFFDVAWDGTWIIVDKRERAISLLCVTDTD
jgi:hypothetical protein